MLAWAVWARNQANETASHLLSQGDSPLLVAQTRAHDGAEVLLFVDTKTACIKGCFPVLQKYGDGICISNEGRVFASPAGMGFIVNVYTGNVLVSFVRNVPTMGTKNDECGTDRAFQRDEPFQEECKAKSTELESYQSLSMPTLAQEEHGHDEPPEKQRRQGRCCLAGSVLSGRDPHEIPPHGMANKQFPATRVDPSYILTKRLH